MPTHVAVRLRLFFFVVVVLCLVKWDRVRSEIERAGVTHREGMKGDWLIGAVIDN